MCILEFGLVHNLVQTKDHQSCLPGTCIHINQDQKDNCLRRYPWKQSQDLGPKPDAELTYEAI